MKKKWYEKGTLDVLPKTNAELFVVQVCYQICIVSYMVGLLYVANKVHQSQMNKV